MLVNERGCVRGLSPQCVTIPPQINVAQLQCSSSSGTCRTPSQACLAVKISTPISDHVTSQLTSSDPRPFSIVAIW